MENTVKLYNVLHVILYAYYKESYNAISEKKIYTLKNSHLLPQQACTHGILFRDLTSCTSPLLVSSKLIFCKSTTSQLFQMLVQKN